MPFDPAYPPANAEIASAPLRNQLNSLKDLIDQVAGETVSLSELDNAIQTTSNNSDAVETLNMASSDPDIQTIADKLDELINTLRRN